MSTSRLLAAGGVQVTREIAEQEVVGTSPLEKLHLPEEEQSLGKVLRKRKRAATIKLMAKQELVAEEMATKILADMRQKLDPEYVVGLLEKDSGMAGAFWYVYAWDEQAQNPRIRMLVVAQLVWQRLIWYSVIKKEGNHIASPLQDSTHILVYVPY